MADLEHPEALGLLDRLDDPEPFGVTPQLVAAAKRRGHQLRRRRRARRLAVAVPLMALLVLAGGLAWVDHRADQVRRVEVATGVLVPVEGGRPFNILVVGTDGPRGEAGARTDALMVVHIDQAANRIRLLSVPRDLVFESEGARLDTVQATAGPSGLIHQIELHLGIPIAHLVEIDERGLAALVDQVGGVRVAVSTRITDAGSGLDLHPGCNLVDGTTAVALVRSRHLADRDAGNGQVLRSYAGGDLQREADQQALVGIIGRQLSAVPLGLSSLDVLLGVFADHTTVDATLSLSELTALASWAHGLSPADLTSATLPTTPFVQASGGDVLRVGPGSTGVITSLLGYAPDVAPGGSVPAPGQPGFTPEPASPFRPCP